MNIQTQLPRSAGDIIYPESDGQPMAENTLQFESITTIKGGLDAVFLDQPDVFVAGDLFWYPVEGRPDIRTAPDVMVVFGRPKKHRGSYLQWMEEGIPPKVTFEVQSPGNRPGEMVRKFQFYERYGVDEYYIYDPDHEGTINVADHHGMAGWTLYEGWKQRGRPWMTLLRGEVLLNQGRLDQKPGFGHFLRRGTPQPPVAGRVR